MSTSGVTPSPAALAELLDKQAIAEVLYRYCRGCDRADERTLRACFHADSQHRHGGFTGSSEDFCTLALRIVAPLKACKHLLTNVLIQVDGDVAFSESHYLAYHREARRKTDKSHASWRSRRKGLGRFRPENHPDALRERVPPQRECPSHPP